VLCYVTLSVGATQKPAFLLDLNASPSGSFTSASRCGMAICVCGDHADTEIRWINQHMQTAQQITSVLLYSLAIMMVIIVLYLCLHGI
jgi:hypothetical protein